MRGKGLSLLLAAVLVSQLTAAHAVAETSWQNRSDSVVVIEAESFPGDGADAGPGSVIEWESVSGQDQAVEPTIEVSAGQEQTGESADGQEASSGAAAEFVDHPGTLDGSAGESAVDQESGGSTGANSADDGEVFDGSAVESTVDQETSSGTEVEPADDREPVPETGTEPATDEGIEEDALEAVLAGGFVLSAEEIDSPAETSEEELACVSSGSFELSHSGYAEDAAQPELAFFSVSEYHESYGEQLEGESRQIYEQMKQYFLTGQTPQKSFVHQLGTPFVFTVYPTGESGSTSWNLDKNEAYQTEIKEEIRYISQAAYDAFVYDYPEAFWVGTVSFSWSTELTRAGGAETGTGRIAAIVFEAQEEYPGAFGDRDRYASAVRAAAAQLNFADKSRAEKVRLIHDYVCSALVYETGQLDPYVRSAGGAFLYGKAVCEGYAKMFMVLCKQAGVPCALIPGKTMSEPGVWAAEDHMWNCVKMENGNWYWVDTTWDDQTSGLVDTYFLCGSGETGFFMPYRIGEERILYSVFSSAEYSQTFVLPDVSGEGYEPGGAGHTHSWEQTGGTDATCSEQGTALYQCACGAVKQEYQNKAEHSFVFRSNQDATCTLDGTKTQVCSVCGVTGETVTDVGSRGHRYQYTSNHDATVFKDGTKTGICQRCKGKIVTVDPGTRLQPTMTLNVSGVLKMKKGQSTTKVKVSGLAKGDAVAAWSSNRPSVVKAEKNGKLTAKKTGSAVITVKLKSGLAKSFTVKVQTKKVGTARITGLEKRITLAVGKKQTLKPVVAPVTSQDKISYTSSNKKVATVSAKGVITAKKGGTAKITVKSGSKKVVIRLTVPKTVTSGLSGIPKKLTLKKGSSRTLKPKRYPVGSDSKLTWTSSDKRVAVVSGKGKITAKKAGKAVITVKAGTAVVTCTVTVK